MPFLEGNRNSFKFPLNFITGLPAYNGTGYSGIAATLTVFGRPNTVTVSGKACTVNWPETRGTEPFIRVGQAIIPRKKEVWAFI